ncbi:MAG: hypothetical protein J6X59_08020 [Bacteroidales bacterium]|nr:hypothetical protein [Bacteroidales bacterium]
MGKQIGGINGPYQGKVGKVVGYQWRGQWCLRAKPREFHDAKTEKQLEQRALFKASVAFAGRLKDILRMGFQRSALKVHKTECNYFLMVNKQCLAWDGEALAVDYEHLRLSEGPVAPVAFTSVERMENELVVEFEKNPEHRNCNSNDRVYVAAVCASRCEAVLSLPVYRRMRSITVTLPSYWADEEVHLYGFVQDSAGRTSESSYIGEVTDLLSIVPDEELNLEDGSHERFGSEGSTVEAVSLDGAVPRATSSPPCGEVKETEYEFR